MKRRVYFLIPDSGHTQAVVDDLEAFGINRGAMHVLAKAGVDLDGLPVATGRQRTDAGARIETILWDGNLAIYLVALLALIAMAFLRLDWYWLLLPAAIMVVSFVMGIVFTTQVPSVHLSEFRDAMQQGELLLMVDVPLWQVERVETLVHTQHPEATAGGVSWHIDALQI